MSQTRPRPKFLICLWLLLATIFGHALLPVESPLVRTTGSAFSASTVDVSIAPRRRALIAATTKSRNPSTAPIALPVTASILVPQAPDLLSAPPRAAAGAGADPPLPDGRAGPGRRAHSPRAPPFA